MNIGPTGIAAGVAGSPLAQTTGAEADRIAHSLDVQRRRIHNDRKAEAAAGVAEPDGENHESADRDADGRLPPDQTPQWLGDEANAPRQGRDHHRERGNLLDLIG